MFLYTDAFVVIREACMTVTLRRVVAAAAAAAVIECFWIVGN
jgi:hypothetical protein